MLAIWLFRLTRPDKELLAPLEVMGERKWRRADPVWQRRRLDEVRPDDAQPLQPSAAPPDFDEASSTRGRRRRVSTTCTIDAHRRRRSRRRAVDARPSRRRRSIRRRSRLTPWRRRVRAEPEPRPSRRRRRRGRGRSAAATRLPCEPVVADADRHRAADGRSARPRASIPSCWRRRSPSSTPSCSSAATQATSVD